MGRLIVKYLFFGQIVNVFVIITAVVIDSVTFIIVSIIITIY